MPDLALGLRRIEIGLDDAPRLQRFFDANPEYSLAVNGRAPHAGEAAEEIAELPPPDLPFSTRRLFGFENGDGELVAFASVLGDFIAAHVWHIGLFIVATRLNGSGTAQALHDELEAWMRSHGARWIRLGVVVGNARAEKFWERCGYVEARRREGVDTGGRINDLRVMVKPLEGTLAEYLERVARDRPGG
jgi:RimJ/RimL family protein N-acetyltransferase